MRAAYKKIPLSASLEMRNLYQKKRWRGKDIAAKFKEYHPRAINRHMKKKLMDTSGDKRKFNGAPKQKTKDIGQKKKGKKKYMSIPLTLSVYLRIMNQDLGVPGKELVELTSLLKTKDNG